MLFCKIHCGAEKIPRQTNSLTQIAYPFFQLVPHWASAGEGSPSIVAHGQGWAGVWEALIHICGEGNTRSQWNCSRQHHHNPVQGALLRAKWHWVWWGLEASRHYPGSQGATSLLRVGAALSTTNYKYKAGFESKEKVMILMEGRIKDYFK